MYYPIYFFILFGFLYNQFTLLEGPELLQGFRVTLLEGPKLLHHYYRVFNSFNYIRLNDACYFKCKTSMNNLYPKNHITPRVKLNPLPRIVESTSYVTRKMYCLNVAVLV